MKRIRPGTEVNKLYAALFIIMDLFIFALLLIALYFLVKKIQEKRQEEYTPIENDLEEFRNDTLHEQAKRDRDKLAHIEEVAACRSFPDTGQEEESDD